MLELEPIAGQAHNARLENYLGTIVTGFLMVLGLVVQGGPGLDPEGFSVNGARWPQNHWA